MRRWRSLRCSAVGSAWRPSWSSVTSPSRAVQTAAMRGHGPRSRRLGLPAPSAKEFTINVVVTEQNCQPGGGCACPIHHRAEIHWLPSIAGHPVPLVKYEVQGGNQPQPGASHRPGSQAKSSRTLSSTARLQHGCSSGRGCDRLNIAISHAPRRPGRIVSCMTKASLPRAEEGLPRRCAGGRRLAIRQRCPCLRGPVPGGRFGGGALSVYIRRATRRRRVDGLVRPRG